MRRFRRFHRARLFGRRSTVVRDRFVGKSSFKPFGPVIGRRLCRCRCFCLVGCPSSRYFPSGASPGRRSESVVCKPFGPVIGRRLCRCPVVPLPLFLSCFVLFCLVGCPSSRYFPSGASPSRRAYSVGDCRRCNAAANSLSSAAFVIRKYALLSQSFRAISAFRCTRSSGSVADYNLTHLVSMFYYQ